MKSFILGILSFLAAVASAAVAGLVIQYRWVIIGRTNLHGLFQGEEMVVPGKEPLYPWVAIVILCLILAEVFWLLSKNLSKKEK